MLRGMVLDLNITISEGFSLLVPSYSQLDQVPATSWAILSLAPRTAAPSSSRARPPSLQYCLS